MLAVACYNLSGFSKKHNIIEKCLLKKFLPHIEFVKAKEIEGNGKERYFSLTSTYFVCQNTR